MAVMNAAYKHPRDSAYSQGLRDLIDAMLKADPQQRLDIHQVCELLYIGLVTLINLVAGDRAYGCCFTESCIVLCFH